jgi:hypothetical protein
MATRKEQRTPIVQTRLQKTFGTKSNRCQRSQGRG